MISSSDPSCPIVFFFHGSGGNSMNHFWRTRDIIHTSTTNTGSSQQPLIGIFPQGAGNVWNTAGQSNVDDMAFILAIVTRLRVMGATGRLYAFGSSNGAAQPPTKRPRPAAERSWRPSRYKILFKTLLEKYNEI